MREAALAPTPRLQPLVLLAERDDDSRIMHARYLIDAAIDVAATADGRHALATALSQRPDVVVTERRVLGIDGYQLCELLRRDSATLATPIVMLADEAAASAHDKAIRSGATVVLEKPCLPAVLLSELRRLI